MPTLFRRLQFVIYFEFTRTQLQGFLFTERRRARVRVYGFSKVHQHNDVTVDELQQYVKDLFNKKTLGRDGIRNNVLKALLPVSLEYFSRLAWRTANVFIISKQDKSHKAPSNYCLISLLSALGKLFEKTILENPQEVIDILNILSAEQQMFTS